MHLKFQKLLGGMPSDPQGAHTWDERTAILSPPPTPRPPPFQNPGAAPVCQDLSFFWVFLSTWPNHSLFHPSKFRPPPPHTWKAGYGHEKPPPPSTSRHMAYMEIEITIMTEMKSWQTAIYTRRGGHVGVSVIWSKVKLHRPIFPRLLQLPPAHLDPPLMHATLFY